MKPAQICVLFLLFVGCPPLARAGEVTGRASIIDGDTIEIHGTRVRLWGIDAPEHDQLCRGEDSLQYRCGARAANELDQFIDSRPVTCLPIDIDRYRRTVASCSVGGVDLARWLVSHGHALDWPRYSKGKYANEQRQAEQTERGIWSGSFSKPWQYRACVRAGASIADCSEEDVIKRKRRSAPTFSRRIG
ncbi:thermonuclease family protein [Bradyrhizobium sp. 17]|uniref:thermonuclease family protein n=1 Tax=Bradyrhizobium sp. 17 TaxID=2782649 RepID=UPI001FFAD121|nr:thermonuclease family protein [Bradyrhizobium sp. 17]MCK1522781.1 thermonuclease family protein [Bradyrhizobium sp. 17]